MTVTIPKDNIMSDTTKDAVPLKRFLYNASIESAAGWQTFYIDADTRDEADERARKHDTDGIYTEEVSVEDLGRLTFDNETTLDDFGDFPPTIAPAQVQAEAEPVAEVIKWRTLTGHTAWDFKVFDKTLEHGAKLYTSPQSSPTAVVLDDLSTLVVRLVRELRKASPDHPLPPKALDYLYRKDLSPTVLRGGKFGAFAEPLSKQPGESHDKPA